MGEESRNLEDLFDALFTDRTKTPWWAAVILEKLDNIQINQETLMTSTEGLGDQLTTILTTLQNDLADLTSDSGLVSQLQSQVSSLTSQLTAAQATISTDSTELTAAQSTLTQLQSTVTQLDTVIQGFNSAVTPGGGSTPPSSPPPVVTGVSPATGSDAGGTSVAVTGSGFTGATAVNFGTAPATAFVVSDDSHLTAVAPPSPDGTVDVTVTTAVGTSDVSAADQFTFSAAPSAPPSALPTVTGVSSPTGGGNPAGGDTVGITGTGFTGAAAVQFGSVAALSFTVVDDSDISAISPAGTGTVDVTVVTSAGTSALSSNDQFSYAAATSPSSTPTTPVPVDPNATPVPAGTLPPDTEVVEVAANVVPVVVPAGAVATTAGSLPPDAIVTPVQ